MVRKNGKKDKKIELDDLNFDLLEKEAIEILKLGEKNAIKKVEKLINQFVEENV